MIPARQILLIVSLACFAFLIGYIPAITSLTIPMLGHDITGLGKNLKPRSLSDKDLSDIYFYLFAGSAFLAIAITIAMKHARGKLISQNEKFKVFFLTLLTSIALEGFLWILLNPEISNFHKNIARFWILYSGVALLLKTIKFIILKKTSRK